MPVLRQKQAIIYEFAKTGNIAGSIYVWAGTNANIKHGWLTQGSYPDHLITIDQ